MRDKQYNKRRFRKIQIMFLIVILLIFSVSYMVYGSDTWDRPLVVFNITPYVINFTDNLDYLEEKIDNETINRILNDSYLQSQINITRYNITQLFDITTIQYYNISQLYNITFNIEQDINDIYDDIDDINDNIVVLNESIISVNTNLTTFIALVNTTIYDLNYSIQDLYNITYIINSSIKQPIGEYLSWNDTNFWINESELNFTINNISENKKYLYIDTINVTGGIGYFTTNYSIEYLLTRITINGLGIYRSECIEYIDGTIIDKDRIPHNQLWDIEKNYAINDKINCSITNANTDGIFNITLTYLNNGLE